MSEQVSPQALNEILFTDTDLHLEESEVERNKASEIAYISEENKAFADAKLASDIAAEARKQKVAELVEAEQTKTQKQQIVNERRGIESLDTYKSAKDLTTEEKESWTSQRNQNEQIRATWGEIQKKLSSYEQTDAFFMTQVKEGDLMPVRLKGSEHRRKQVYAGDNYAQMSNAALREHFNGDGTDDATKDRIINEFGNRATKYVESSNNKEDVGERSEKLLQLYLRKLNAVERHASILDESSPESNPQLDEIQKTSDKQEVVGATTNTDGSGKFARENITPDQAKKPQVSLPNVESVETNLSTDERTKEEPRDKKESAHKVGDQPAAAEVVHDGKVINAHTSNNTRTEDKKYGKEVVLYDPAESTTRPTTEDHEYGKEIVLFNTDTNRQAVSAILEGRDSEAGKAGYVNVTAIMKQTNLSREDVVRILNDLQPQNTAAKTLLNHKESASGHGRHGILRSKLSESKQSNPADATQEQTPTETEEINNHPTIVKTKSVRDKEIELKRLGRGARVEEAELAILKGDRNEAGGLRYTNVDSIMQQSQVKRDEAINILKRLQDSGDVESMPKRDDGKLKRIIKEIGKRYESGDKVVLQDEETDSANGRHGIPRFKLAEQHQPKKEESREYDKAGKTKVRKLGKFTLSSDLNNADTSSTDEQDTNASKDKTERKSDNISRRQQAAKRVSEWLNSYRQEYLRPNTIPDEERNQKTSDKE